MVSFHIDREPQLAWLTELLHTSSSEIALMVAPESMGKTELVFELQERVADGTQIIYVDVGVDGEPEAILGEIAAQVERHGTALPGFRALRTELALAPHGMSFQGSIAIGNRFTQYLDPARAVQRQLRQLLEILVQEIGAAPALPRAYVLDTCESAQEIVLEWLTADLLPTLLDTGPALFLFAGRSAPTPRRQHARRSVDVAVSPFAFEDVVEWLSRVGTDLGKDQLEAMAHTIHVVSGGTPGTIHRMVQMLLNKGWRPSVNEAH